MIGASASAESGRSCGVTGRAVAYLLCGWRHRIGLANLHDLPEKDSAVFHMSTRKTATRQRNSLDDRVRIMRRLRGPRGCPGDRKQNHRTLLPYLLEESYEVIDSVERRDMK